MIIHRRTHGHALALLALALGGCSKKETPATAEPIPSAAPVSAPATPTASAAPTTSAGSMEKDAPDLIAVTKETLTRGESVIEYVQIKHPNAPAVDIVNRLLKKEAEKEAADIAGRKMAGRLENVSCEAGLPAPDILWVRLRHATSYENRGTPYGLDKYRVWSLAGKEPSRIELTAQLSSGWLAAANGPCLAELQLFTWVAEGSVKSIAEYFRKDDWRPLKEGLSLGFGQGMLGPLGDGMAECTIPWDSIARFLQPGSPLRPIADAAPPSPPPPPRTPLENRPPPSPFGDPGRQPRGLPPPLDAQQSACDGGDQRACVKVGEALFAGEQVNGDEGLAVWIFQKACDAGEPTGCVNLGWVYLNGPFPEAGASAAPIFAKACTDKVAIGCLGLGTIYRDGRDTPKDAARAAELFKKACDGGVKAGCSLAKATKP